MDHQTGKKQRFPFETTVTVILTSIAAVVEWAAFHSLLGDRISLATGLGFHLAVVLLLSAWFLLQLKTGMDIRLTALVLLMITVTGPFGSLISVLMLVFFLGFSNADISFLQWLSALFPEERVEKSIELYQRLSAGWDDFSEKKRIMTFQDALALGTIQQKREALAKISRYFRREFAPALMSALHDSDNAIRVQAATVIAKFEQEYMSRYMQLSRQHKEDPDDPDILLKLAQQADAYAYSGILDREREADFRKIATEHFLTYLEKDPENDQVLFSLGRLYIHLGKPERSFDLLHGFMSSGQKPPLNLAMWLIESLYSLGRYSEIRELVSRYQDELLPESDQPIHIIDTLQLWENGITSEKLMIKLTNDV